MFGKTQRTIHPQNRIGIRADESKIIDSSIVRVSDNELLCIQICQHIKTFLSFTTHGKLPDTVTTIPISPYTVMPCSGVTIPVPPYTVMPLDVVAASRFQFHQTRYGRPVSSCQAGTVENGDASRHAAIIKVVRLGPQQMPRRLLEVDLVSPLSEARVRGKTVWVFGNIFERTGGVCVHYRESMHTNRP